MATQPLVTIKDADGNVVSTGSQSTQTVTISIATGATLTGTASMSAVAGVADFTGKGITLTGAVGSKVLTATISSPSNITTTASVSLSFGVATKLAINQATVSATNRVNFSTQPVVTVQDANGNTISDSTAAITVTVDSANVTLGGSTSVNAVSGVYTFSGSKLSGTVGTYTITYASSGLTSVTQTVTLVAGAVDHITLTASTTAQNAIALSTQPYVTTYDIDNNVTNTVTQSVSIAATGATLSGTTTQAASAGIADFTGNSLALTGTVGTKTLTASVVINGTTFTSNSLSIQLNAGNATKLGLTQSALGAASRKVIATHPVLEVQDVSGNRVPGRTDTITVSASGVTLGGDTSMAAVDGTATFANNANGLKLSGTVGTYTLTYAATGLTSATQSIALTFGDASQLTVHTAAADAKAGIAFVTQPVIWIQDADSNLVTSGVGSDLHIRASSSDGTIGGTYTVQASSGVATFTDLKLSNVTGTYNLAYTATDNGFTSLSTSQTILLAAGTAVKLGVTVEPSSGGATGSVFATQPRVAVLDAFNNVVLTDNGRTITASYANANGGTLSGSPNLTATTSNGVAIFSGLKFVGTPGTNYSIHFAVASDTLTATDSANFTVTHAAASQIVIVQQPIGGNAVRSPLTVQPIVEIQDQYGNTVTTGSDSTRVVTVNIHSDNGTGRGDLSTGQQTVTAVGGRATFTNVILSDAVINNNYTLDFTASLGGTVTTSAASSAFQVIHAAASQIGISRQASGAASGSVFTTTPNVAVRDAEGNVVNDGAGSTAQIRVTVSTGGTLIGTTTVAAVNGIARFTDLGLSGLVGTYTLNYEGVGLGFSTVSQSVTLTFGAVDHIGISTQPVGGHATGAAFTTAPVVTVYDAVGNVVTDSTISVVASVASGDGQATLSSATKAAVNGVASFSALRLVGTPGQI
jgi:hypothetical protein